MKEKVITAAYTMLDTKRTASDDDFFRVRALEAHFPVNADFADLCAGGRCRDGRDGEQGHHASSSC